MLPASKKPQLLNDLKSYKKKYVNEKYYDLDESATRIMINEFLTTILGYKSLDEVKTEYMIKGTYADYVVQLNGRRHFLVEVKAMNIDLSEKHLRQAVMYAANEGIEWALLTNGREFELYKVLFTQPIESKLVFSFNIAEDDIKNIGELVQFLTKPSVQKKGLEYLWSKCSALDPQNVASLLYSKSIISVLKKELKAKYKITFDDVDIINSVRIIIEDSIEGVKMIKERKARKASEKQEPVQEVVEGGESTQIEEIK